MADLRSDIAKNIGLPVGLFSRFGFCKMFLVFTSMIMCNVGERLKNAVSRSACVSVVFHLSWFS